MNADTIRCKAIIFRSALYSLYLYFFLSRVTAVFGAGCGAGCGAGGAGCGLGGAGAGGMVGGVVGGVVGAVVGAVVSVGGAVFNKFTLSKAPCIYINIQKI
jgi:hypothetical protein